jgi:voltage-gated potassium channel
MKDTASHRFRHRLHEIIHEADTPAGKLFDVTLLVLIILSIVAVMLESVDSVRAIYGPQLNVIEWIITFCFSLEYIGRLITVRKPLSYALSFAGVIDLLATLPAYISLIFPGLHFLMALRAIRLLRVFRVLKLAHFVGASDMLASALRSSRVKIAVFLFTVIVVCIISGTVMYIVEGPEHGFANIPVSIYWTIVTLTTVGFGDITPQTPLGQFISMVIMILGYGIIAVPTGIVTSHIVSAQSETNTQACPNCNVRRHRDDANYCYNCGTELNA